MKKCKWSLLVTVALLIALVVGEALYQRARGPVEGAISVQQLENSDASYMVARSIAAGDFSLVFQCGMTFLILYWVVEILVTIRYRKVDATLNKGL